MIYIAIMYNVEKNGIVEKHQLLLNNRQNLTFFYYSILFDMFRQSLP